MVEKATPTKRTRIIRPRVYRTSIISAVLLAVGLVAYHNPYTTWWGILVIFTAALVIGEALELQVVERPPIPVSFAIIMALARTTTNGGSFSWTHVSIVIVASVLIAAACYSDVTTIARTKVFISRTITYTIGVIAARILFTYVNESSQWLYAALIAAIITMLVAHEILAWIGGYRRTYSFFAAAAHASIIAGGVLVGVGYAGTKGVENPHIPEGSINGLGISALVTCSIPLLVAWFAFSRYYTALKTYKQTIRALSAAPELGGIVAWGHTNRVAQLSRAIAERLGISEHEKDNIETACYMHTLGDAILDTTIDIDPYEEAEAARISADIIRQSRGLDRIANIIDEHIQPYRGIIDGNFIAQNDIAASIMRVANDYDNISRHEESWGIRALAPMHQKPIANYNPQALEALEWVLNNELYSELVEPPIMPERIKANLD